MEEKIKCPHCGNEKDIEPESDYGEDGKNWTEECSNCEKEYEVTLSISYSWTVECAPGTHELTASPNHKDWFDCSKCDGFIHKDNI